MRNWFEIECPECGAKPDAECVTRAGEPNKTGPHARRKGVDAAEEQPVIEASSEPAAAAAPEAARAEIEQGAVPSDAAVARLALCHAKGCKAMPGDDCVGGVPHAARLAIGRSMSELLQVLPDSPVMAFSASDAEKALGWQEGAASCTLDLMSEVFLHLAQWSERRSGRRKERIYHRTPSGRAALQCLGLLPAAPAEAQTFMLPQTIYSAESTCDDCGDSYPGCAAPHPDGGHYCVTCWPGHDVRTGTSRVTRLDTRKVIEERPLTQRERQMALALEG